MSHKDGLIKLRSMELGEVYNAQNFHNHSTTIDLKSLRENELIGRTPNSNLKTLRSQEFHAPSKKAPETTETIHKHINYQWTPILVFFLVMAAVAIVLAILSYVEIGNNAETVENTIFNTISGTYAAVKAASTGPVLEQQQRSSFRIVFTESLVIDGVLIEEGDRVLLKNESNPQTNGIYTLTNYELLRTPDMSMPSQVTAGNSIYVTEGNVNGGSSFTLFKLSSDTNDNDEITGAGITFTNTTSVLLGLDTQAPAPGDYATYDPLEPTKIRWVRLLDKEGVTEVLTGPGLLGGPIREAGTISFAPLNAFSLWGNSTDQEAVPAAFQLNVGEILSQTNTGLTLAPGDAGKVLTSAGPGQPLIWTTNESGTVDLVETGTGLTGGPITESGTISFAAINAYSLWTNSTNASAVPAILTLAQGELLTRSNGSLTLAAGSTEGQVLTSNGTNADITWSAYAFPLALGSSGTLLTSNGTAVVFSTATYPSAATAEGTILRSNGTDWVGSTATFANTYAVNTLLYAGTANTITSLATAANGVLVTDAGSVPSISSQLPTAVMDNITRVGVISSGTWQGNKIGLLYGGTNTDLSTTGGTNYVLRQNSAGANITVSQLAASDLSNGVTGTGSLVLSQNPTITGNLNVNGNMIISGSTTTTYGQDILFGDRYMVLNALYNINSAVASGMVFNYFPTSVNTTLTGNFVPGVNGVSNPNVTSATSVFGIGDLILINGTTFNDGIYEVLSNIGGTLTIKGVGTTACTYFFTSTQFTSEAITGTVTARKTAVTCMNCDTSGILSISNGASNTDAMTFSNIYTTSSIIPIANGGTGANITVTQYGLPYFSTSTTMASTAAGTNTQVLHGNASGAPTWSAVSLSADVSGTLPVANGGTGTTTQFTTGSVVFAGASGVYSQDNANFFWDNTNDRLAIGMTAPIGALQLSRPGNSQFIVGSSTNSTAFDAADANLSDLAGFVVHSTLLSGAPGNQVSLVATGRDTGNYSSALLFWTRASGTVNPTESMRIDRGNVSIGSQTTTSLFNVGSSAQFQINSSGIVTNGTWQSSTAAIGLAYGGTGANITATQYGVPYFASATAMASTAAGTIAQVLHGNASGAPTWSAVALGTDVSGTLPIANGGTGANITVTQYGLPYFSTSTAMASTAAPASSSQVLHGNASGAPTWSTVALATDVSGTLAVTNGGTGTTTQFTTGSVVFAGASGVYSQDNANFFWDNTNDRLAIGMTAPIGALQLSRPGNSQFIVGSSTNSTAFDPADTNLSDLAGFVVHSSLISGQGHQVSLVATGRDTSNFSSTILFWTRGSGVVNPTESMRINAGNVSIGSTTTTSLFNVGSSAQFQINTSGIVTSGTWQSTTKIALAYGGTNANITAAAGAIVYSTASELALSSTTASQYRILQSGTSGTGQPSWSTYAMPSSITGTTGKVLSSNGTDVIFSAFAFPTTVGATGTILRSNGTDWVATTATFPNTAGTSGTLLTSNGTAFTNTTATYPGTAGTTSTILRSNGTDWVNSSGFTVDATGYANATGLGISTSSSTVPCISIVGNTPGALFPFLYLRTPTVTEGTGSRIIISNTTNNDGEFDFNGISWIRGSSGYFQQCVVSGKNSSVFIGGNNSLSNTCVGLNDSAPRCGLSCPSNAQIGFPSLTTAPANSLIVGGNVGIGIRRPINRLSVAPVFYESIGTAVVASQTGYVVTATGGTPFTASFVGLQLIWTDGTYGGIIVSQSSTTVITVNVSQTIASQAFTVNYIGMGVDNSGDLLNGITYSPTTTTVTSISPFSSGAVSVSGTAATIQQSASTTVTGVNTNFTATHVGMYIMYSDGVIDVIRAVNSTTSIVVGTSRTKGPLGFTLHNAGLNVTTGGQVSVGLPTGGSPFSAVGTVWAPNTNYKGIANLYSLNPLATDMGAGIILGGTYLSPATNQTEFAQIVGGKNNSTAGNYDGNLQLYVRQNGVAALTEAMRISPNLGVQIGYSLATPAASGLIVSGNTSIGSSSTTSLFNVGTANAFQINASGQVTSGAWQSTTRIGLAYGGTNTDTSSGAEGGVAYKTASGIDITAVGISGQVLQSNGAGAPSWVTPSSGGVTSITGTANQITASASTGAVTLSLPSALITPGFVNSGAVMLAGDSITSSGTTNPLGYTRINPNVYLYVSQPFSSNVSVFRYATSVTPTLLTTLSFSSLPFSGSCIAISPSGYYAYIIANGVVNLVKSASSNTPYVSTAITVGTDPYAVAFTPDGNYLYVTNSTSNNVSIIQNASSESPTVLTTLSTIGAGGSAPREVAVTPNGNYAYIPNNNGTYVCVIQNASTNSPTVLTHLSLGINLLGVCITPNGNYAYVTDNGSNNVYVIQNASTNTPTVLTTVNIGASPSACRVTPNGNYVLVNAAIPNRVVVIQNASTNSPSVLTFISLGTDPSGLSISSNGSFCYTCTLNTNTVTILQSASTGAPSVLGTISVSFPLGVAVASNFVTVANNTMGLGLGLNDPTSILHVGGSLALSTNTLTAQSGVHFASLLAPTGSGTITNAASVYVEPKFIKGSIATFTQSNGVYIDTYSLAAVSNYGLFAKVPTSGSTSNIAIYGDNLSVGYSGVALSSGNMIVSGSSGVGTSIPRKKLDVLDAAAAQIRLTQADNSVYTDMQTNSSGHLLIQPSSGSIVPGTGALATNATQGFVYEETCAGKPTGVPTTYTGRAAQVYDTTNNVPWVYNVSWQNMGGRTLIATVTNTGTATIVFSSIPQVFNHLQVILVGQQTSTGDVQVQVNGITTTTYDNAVFYENNGGTPATGLSGAGVSGWQVGPLPTSTSPGTTYLDFPFYSNTSWFKTIQIRNVYMAQSNANNRITFGGGSNRATTAISSITITASTLFINGTFAYLYGMV